MVAVWADGQVIGVRPPAAQAQQAACITRSLLGSYRAFAAAIASPGGTFTSSPHIDP